MDMPTIYLALGTNLGDRMQNLRHAIRQLAPNITVTRLSAVYETAPWGVTDQPDFLNLVLEGQTALSPIELLDLLKAVEQNMGRTQAIRYGPRIIDLDILLYDDVLIQTQRLEIPHLRLAERRFVLVPLDELAPNLLHPRLGKTIHELLADLDDDSALHRFPEHIALTDVTSNN